MLLLLLLLKPAAQADTSGKTKLFSNFFREPTRRHRSTPQIDDVQGHTQEEDATEN